MDRLKNICWWLADTSMLLLCALLPFIFIPVQWMTVAQGKVIVVVILLSLAAIGWIVAALIDGGSRWSGGLILLAGALLPIVYAISAYLSGLSPVALVGTGVEQDTLAAACIGFGALALGCLIFCGNSLLSVKALRALFVGGFILCVIEIAHIIAPAQLTFGGTLAGQTGNPLGDWYQLGISLGFFLLFSLACLKTPVGEGIWRGLLGIVAILSFLILIVISLRDVWIAVAIVSVIFVLLDIFARRSLMSAVQSSAHWIALAIIATIFAVFTLQINTALPPQFRIESLQVRPSLQGTLAIGRHTLSEPKALLFGSGPNSFSREWGLYKPLSVNQTPFWNVDFSVGLGSIPTTFVTIGFVGVAAWALFIFSVLWIAIKGVRRSREAEGVALLVMPLVLVSLYLIGFHVMYVPGPALSVLMFVLVGLLLGLAASAHVLPMKSIHFRGLSIRSMASTLVALVLTVLFLSAALSAGRVVFANALLDHSIMLFNSTKDAARSSALVSQALRIYPNSDRAQRAAVELGIVQLKDLASKANPQDAAALEQLQAQLKTTINHGLAAVSINDTDYQNWLALAFLYQQLVGTDVSGAYQNAIIAYEKAAAANPTNPLPLVRLAQLQLIQNNVISALENLAAAVKLKPDLPIAYYLASQGYASQNDFKDAVLVAKQVTVYDPSDPLGWYNYGSLAYVDGNFVLAESALKQALVREPQYANALYVLGLSYYKVGKVQEAYAAFEQLNAIQPNQQVVLQILDNLSRGKDPFAPVASTTSTNATSTRQ